MERPNKTEEATEQSMKQAVRFAVFTGAVLGATLLAVHVAEGEADCIARNGISFDINLWECAEDLGLKD